MLSSVLTFQFTSIHMSKIGLVIILVHSRTVVIHLLQVSNGNKNYACTKWAFNSSLDRHDYGIRRTDWGIEQPTDHRLGMEQHID